VTDDSGNALAVFENGPVKAGKDSVTYENWKEILVRRKTSIGTERGFHRLVWDLATFGPVPGGSGPGGSRGVKVVPGTYHVKIEADGEVAVGDLYVSPDPLVIDDGVTIEDLGEQYGLAVKVRDLLSETRILSEHISLDMKTLLDNTGRKGKLSGSDRKEYDDLAQLNSQIVNDTVPYPQGMLLEQVTYLYSMLGTADQKPGRDAAERFEELTGILSVLKDEYKKIVKK
jgi:hypothetical protein